MAVFGTAQFADRAELAAAGLLAPGDPTVPPDGLMVGYWWESPHDFQPLAYRGDLHQLIVGGTGGGKFVSALAPLLLGSGLEGQSVVVVDPKGEIAQVAGPFFQQAFAASPSVFLLDPWDVCGTGRTSALTFLSELTPDNPNCIDDARALADAMIIPASGDSAHWDQTARNFLGALLLYLALDPVEKGRRDLTRLRELVTLPWAMPKDYEGPRRQTLSGLLHAYEGSDLAHGVIRRAFTALLNREERERSGIVSTIERDTAWIDSPQMRKVLTGKSLDLKQAALGAGKYFVVIPPDFFMTHRGWLRLAVAAFSKAFKRYRPEPKGPQHRRWRHIVIDEFPNLGEMSFVVNDLAVSRGYDIKYHFAVQDFAQLHRIYHEGWESFVGNSFLRAFAVNDLFTAKYLSEMLGAATVESVTQSQSQGKTLGESDSVTQGMNLTDSTGRRQLGQSKGTTYSFNESFSSSSGRSISPVQRPLYTPDEVRRLKGNAQLLFFRGMHPIECWRPPYWDIFPSLPKFTLKEVLGTLGRAPRNKAERARYLAWRKAPLLMAPQPRPEPELPPPEPEPPPAPEPEPVVAIPALHRRVTIAAMTFVGLVLCYWLWPSARAPEPSRPVVSETRLAPPTTRPVAPMPVSLPPKTRAAVPRTTDIGDARRAPENRDFLLNLARANADLCNPAHAKEEAALIEYLITHAFTKTGSSRVPEDDPRLAMRERYRLMFADYRHKPSLSRDEKEEVFELILRSVQNDVLSVSLQDEIRAAIARLYAGNACPFGTVADADYLAPAYAEMKLPVPVRRIIGAN